jgi:hypothetical protein
MTMPSSTSQSVFFEPRGIRTVVVRADDGARSAFMKMIGSGGTLAPVFAAAWSE